MSKEDQNAITGLLVALIAAAGLALAGSAGGASVAGIPLFALGVGLALVIQWIAFIPAFARQTESFYDLTGSFTYVTVIVVAVVLSPGVGARGYVLLAVVIIWAVRLGSFLFTRIRAAGSDRRFDDIKPSFARFLLAWTLQGLWVSFSLAAALAAITSGQKPEFDAFAGVGLAVWLAGFAVEVIADRQKRQFRASPDNKGKFIQTGLWAWSRHPNYFGEIVLWVGVAIMAFPALRGWRLLTLISPLFVTLLLTRISGIPLLEQQADAKWGGQPDYEAYKARTPALIPRPPGARN